VTQKVVRFGVIGGGLMGRQFASECSRWLHLLDINARPEIVAIADPSPAARQWFVDRVPSIKAAEEDYRALLGRDDIDAIYCAVPHTLHEQVFVDVIEAGKHLLGEKPFGIDQAANDKILKAAAARPELIVRCSSEFPFFPGAQAVYSAVNSGRLGEIFEVRVDFSHCSDLDPNKKMNWKRSLELNGEYGVMGDLGMHAVHLPFRLGWTPTNVFALLSNIVKERPGDDGTLVPCLTWDNATLACETTQGIPMIIDIKRIAPGETNTWSIEVYGTRGSIRWSTKAPKALWTLDYEPGAEQSWANSDIGSQSVYKTIVDGYLEFGFSDSLLQMWAAYVDEVANGDAMQGAFRCATLEETALQHALFTAALESAATKQAVAIGR
jgi:predicted dehydrogenase